MLIISKEENSDKFNRPLYGLKGQYTLAEGISLPYFLCTMPIERAINELKIAEQVPASLEAKWSIKQLFQREIDEDRILNDIIKSYLLDPKKLKFFNAITIVLMPKSKEEKIQDKFQDTEENSPPPIPWDGSNEEDKQWNHSEAKQANFGGVQFISIGQQARLRWDENKVLAVAVDGQHRLWALRTFRENERFRGGTLRSSEKQTQIPVIFVLLHEKAGFNIAQNQTDHSIRSISRELFTDLNKNAKTVEDRIFSILLLWYYGNRKLQQDNKVGKPKPTRRELLKFFRGEVNKAEWAGCTDAYRALEKGFNITTFYPFYGKEKDEISKEKQQNLVREHFSKVLAVGIPDLANQVDDLSTDDEKLE